MSEVTSRRSDVLYTHHSIDIDKGLGLVEIPSTFTRFSSLPVEVRYMIWEQVAQVPRNLDIWAEPVGEITWIHNRPLSQQWKFLTTRRPPAILHTNRESRIAGLKHYHLEFAMGEDRDGCTFLSGEPRIYLNPILDRICPMGYWSNQAHVIMFAPWKDQTLPAVPKLFAYNFYGPDSVCSSSDSIGLMEDGEPAGDIAKDIILYCHEDNDDLDDMDNFQGITFTPNDLTGEQGQDQEREDDYPSLPWQARQIKRFYWDDRQRCRAMIRRYRGQGVVFRRDVDDDVERPQLRVMRAITQGVEVNGTGFYL